MYYFDIAKLELLKADKVEASAGQEVKITVGDAVRYIDKSLVGTTPEEAMNRASANARDNEAYYKKTAELAEAQYKNHRDNLIRFGEYINKLYSTKE
jgi:hypothetical protein